MYNRYILFLCVIVFIMFATHAVYSRQLSFNKSTQTANRDVVEFSYEFDDSRNTTHKVQFSLPKSAVQQAHTIIPSISVLRDYFSVQSSEISKSLSTQYIADINTLYTSHVQSLLQTTRTAQKAPGFAIKVECPKAPVQYIYTFNERAMSDEHKINTKTCRIVLDNTEAIRIWKEDIRAETVLVQKELEYGSVYRFIDAGSGGYKLDIRLQAPDTETLNAYKAKIEASGRRIEVMTQEFDRQQAQQKQVYDQIAASHTAFWDTLQSDLRGMIRDISSAINVRQQEFLQQNFFLKEQHTSNSYIIRLDYRAIVEYSMQYARPLADALKVNSSDVRKQIINTLNFIQSIPYNTLQGRDIQGYSGFLSPLALLDKNKGDCDTKSVMYITVMDLLLPEIENVFVLIDKHAFVGVAIPPKKGESTFMYKGTQYVVIEPVGPHLSKIGEPSTYTAAALRNNNFQKVIEFK